MSIRRRIINKHRALFVVNDRLRKIAKKMINAQPQINTPKDGVACFMLAKAYKTHGVATNLAKNGYSEDADMLIRTLFDTALIISSCLEDKSDGTVSKYLNFDYSIRAAMFKQLQDQGKFKDYFANRKKNPKPGDMSIQEIQEKAERWVEKYGGDFRRKWHSGKTTGQLAESVNLKKYFTTAFGLQSQLSHSLPRSMDFYLVDDGKQIKMSVEPNEHGADLSIVTAFNMLFVTVEQFNKYFKILPKDKLEKLVSEWEQAIGKKKLD